jgi:plastocyanin
LYLITYEPVEGDANHPIFSSKGCDFSVKKIAVIAFYVLAIWGLAACGSSSTPSPASPTNTPTRSPANTITMGANTFSTTSISITRGSTITFTNDPSSGTEHILVIGDKGAPATEAGAPDFGGAAGTTIQAGSSFTTSAWNTDGTFHVTCIIHPTTMNLTITVTG